MRTLRDENKSAEELANLAYPGDEIISAGRAALLKHTKELLRIASSGATLTKRLAAVAITQAELDGAVEAFKEAARAEREKATTETNTPTDAAAPCGCEGAATSSAEAPPAEATASSSDTSAKIGRQARRRN